MHVKLQSFKCNACKIWNVNLQSFKICDKCILNLLNACKICNLLNVMHLKFKIFKCKIWNLLNVMHVKFAIF